MRKKNFVIIVGLILCIFLIGVVVASISSTDCGGKALFKVSGTTNAHAGTYDGSSYPYFVCFDEYTGTDIRDGTTNYAKLSSPTNAHIGSTSSSYVTLLDYADDVVCEIKASCGVDQINVASISSEDNAHVGGSSDYPNWKICCENVGSEGPTCGDNNIETGEVCECGVNGICGNSDDNLNGKDCTTIPGGYSGGTLYCGSDCTGFDTSSCTSVIPCSINDVYWKESGTNIEGERVIYEGNQVSLIVQGTGDCNGKTVSLGLRETDGWLGDSGVSFESFPTTAIFSGVTATASWNVEWMDDNLLALDINPEYVFTATYETITLNSKNHGSDGSIIKIIKCGDGVCNGGETTASCSDDCPASCIPTTPVTQCHEEDIYTWDGCSWSFQTDCDSCDVWTYSCVGDLLKRERICYSGCAGASCTNTPKPVETETTDCTNTDGGYCDPETNTCKTTSPYWADMQGTRLPNNPLIGAEIGDSVLMIYPRAYDSGYVFDIVEKSWSDEKIVSGIEAFNFNGENVGKWTITQEDYDKTGNQHDRYVFQIDSKESGELKVSENIFNTPPTATITAPPEGSNYTLNYNLPTPITNEITFSQSSYDVDDDIKVQWDFSDGTTSSWFENCLTTGDCNEPVTHNYSIPGTKSIILTAQEMERGQWDWDSRNIFVYGEGLQVFSIIDSPFVTGRLVKLNASNSKLVNCTNGLEAKPGNNWYMINDSEGEGSDHPLWCYDFPKPGETGADYNFILKWTLDEDEENVIEGLWSEDYDEVVEFSYVFPNLGVHTVKLEVGYFKL